MRTRLDWRHYAAMHEFRILLVLGIVLVGIWGFVELSEMVSVGQTTRIDTAILMALRNPADPSQPIGPPRRTAAMLTDGRLFFFMLRSQRGGVRGRGLRNPRPTTPLPQRRGVAVRKFG